MQTRDELLRKLADTERQILHGALEGQRRLLAPPADGRDVAKDKALLELFEQSQAMREGEMDSLLDALDRIPDQDASS